MATASLVQVDVGHAPVCAVAQLSEASAEETNSSLQKNHQNHHIFFENKIGLHNHLVHQVLTLFALGATPSQISRNYANNCSYQLPRPPIHKVAATDLADINVFTDAEGKKESYTDFLVFFESQISAKGWLSVLEEYVFADDERANRLLRKLCAGILHSLIHLGFGVEFEQPAIIAEALAEAAVHADELEPYFFEVNKQGAVSDGREGLHKLYNELRANTKITHATTFEARFPFGDGIFKNAMQEMADIAARYRVHLDDIDARMKEVINVDAFLTASTQLPPHYPRLDFFLIHSHNATVFLPAFHRHLRPAHFARLLELQVRTDMLGFASLAFHDIPTPQLSHVLSVAPAPDKGKTWHQLFEQANSMDDDGHVVKCLRALKHAEEAAGQQTKYEEPLKREEVLPVAQVWMKGTVGETNDFGTERLWTRGGGFRRAWGRLPLVEEVLERQGRD